MKKSKLIVALSVMVMAILVVFATGTEAEAASKKQKKWAQAYLNVIKKENKRGGSENFRYGFAYVNNDKIPELVVCDNSFDAYNVYYYNPKTKKACLALQTYSSSEDVKYIPKKNYLEYYSSSMAGAFVTYDIYKVKNNKLAVHKNLRIQKVEDSATMKVLKKPRYYCGDKKISKKKFNSYLKKKNKKALPSNYTFKEMRKKLVAKGAK